MNRYIGVFFCAAIIWIVGVMLFLPAPEVSLAFGGSEKVEVRQVFDRSGHFHLKVDSKEAISRFTSLTIGGVPVFSREWLVANVASTVPLGESEIVDFPRFFDLLPKMFRIARVGLGLFPLCMLIFYLFFRYGISVLKRRCGQKVFVATMIFTTVLSLPEPVIDSIAGLDSSWSWFLCRFAFQNVFGNNVVFTYGPLGFLLYPQEFWGCVLCALAANLVFVVLWFCISLQIFNHSVHCRKTAWILLASSMIPVAMEWKWTMLAILYSAVPYLFSEQDRMEKRWNWAVAGLLAALVSLMKFSSMTIVLGAQCFCLFAHISRFYRKGVRDAIFFVCSFSISFAILSFVCFSSVKAWVAWVHGSVATASGYNLYMVAEKLWFEVAIPFFLGFAFVTSVGWRYSLLFAPVIFLTAKYAWVRQTCGPMAYSLALLSALCLVNGRINVRRVVGLFCVALFFNIALTLPSALSGLEDIQSICGLKPYALYHTLTLKKSVRASFARSEDAVTKFSLPSSWRERIGTNSVVFLPYELSPAMADDTLNVVPLPSLQLYSACHPYLDTLNADYFGSGIPDYIICGITAPGCGYFINYPRTWCSLLTNYESVGENGKFVLLAKRKCPRPLPYDLIFLQNERSFAEKCYGLFFRNPVEYVVVESKDGSSRRFQFVRGNQGVPFPLEWIPFDDNDMCEILKGGKGRVVCIKQETM